ncbi:MAG: hypothetical protein ABIF09_04695 [Gemmatimonadota bacterium]
MLRAAVWYAGVGLAFASNAEYVLEMLGFPLSAAQFVAILVLAGFPIALVISGVVEISPAGVQRRSPATSEELAAHSPVRWTRGGWALVGAGTLVVLAAGYLALFRLASPLPADRVAVFPFENLTGDPTRDEWGVSTARYITDALYRTDELEPEPVDNLLRTLAASGESEDALAIAAQLGLGTAVTGEVLTGGRDSVVVLSRILRVRDGKQLHDIRESGPSSAFESLIHSIRERVAGGLVSSLDSNMAHYLRRPYNYQAYQAFWQGEQDFNALNWQGAIANYWVAYQQDKTFLTALVGIGVAAANDGRREWVDSVISWVKPRLNELAQKERFWFEWLTAKDRPSRLSAVRREMKRDPDNLTRILHGMEELDNGYLWEAIGVLEEVNPEDPLAQANWGYWRTLADAYHLSGRYREELEGMETVPDRVSPGGVILQTAAWAAHHEHPEKAKEIGERGLNWERGRYPEHAQNLAWALLMADQPREALNLLDSLVSESPDDRWLHRLRGTTLAGTGDGAAAQEEADWLEAIHLSYPPGETTLWRTEIAAPLGQREVATQLLRQSLHEGRVRKDLCPVGAFASLLGYEPFEELRRPKDEPLPEPTFLERLRGLLRRR